MLEQGIAALSEIYAAPVTARALARMVHDVINWRGQSRHFLQRAHEAARLPPVKVFWGDRDAPVLLARSSLEFLEQTHPPTILLPAAPQKVRAAIHA